MDLVRCLARFATAMLIHPKLAAIDAEVVVAAVEDDVAPLLWYKGWVSGSEGTITRDCSGRKEKYFFRSVLSRVLSISELFVWSVFAVPILKVLCSW